MQIQPSNAANAAASNVSQAASKDRGGGGTSEAAAAPSSQAVERVARSEEASADRDAQGGGQGLDSRNPGQSPDTPASPTNREYSELPVKPPEPPSELDLVG